MSLFTSSDCRTPPEILRATAILFVSVVVTCLPAAASPEDDIRAVLTAQTAAWNRGDIESFMTSYEDSDKTSFVSDEILLGYNTLLKRYETVYGGEAEMGKLAFSDIAIRMLSDSHALVIGRFHLARDAAGGGDLRGIYSLVWALVDGNWKIIHDHTSALDQ